MVLGTSPVNTYAGNIAGRSNIDSFIPNVWAEAILRYRNSALFMKDCVNMRSFVGKKGDTLHIPRIGRSGVRDVIHGQPVFLQAMSPDEYTMVVDQHKESSYGIHDIVNVQSQYDLMSEYAMAAGRAMALDINNAILALRAGVPTEQHIYRTTGAGAGTAAGDPASLDQATVVAAMQVMMDNRIPLRECKWILSPNQYLDLLLLEVIQNSDYTLSQGINPTSINESGAAGTLYNIPIYVSTEITDNTLDGYIAHEGATGAPTPGVAGSPYLPTQGTVVGGGLARGKTGNEVAQPFQTGMLVHKDWANVVVQQNLKVESSRETLLLMDAMVTTHIYGAKNFRDDHSVLIFSEGNG